MALYLKSLELSGFKSFTQPTRIAFRPGITGIVGPNGCGKSNIVEAIKWVLGEQSAKSLRGEKMQDVIFNGTKHRSPMSMASVHLLFDNETHWLPIDYSEVQIARRLFRTGEGQYLMNRNKTRLKDIVDLFLDTGVGKGSYAIFEQGKIDRLLSESPEERRSLFEDFAGISRFKARREEAERKLQKTQEHLEQLQPILSQLETERDALEQQAQDARSYEALRQERFQLERQYDALRIREMERDVHSKQQALEKLLSDIQPIQALAKEHENALSEKQDQIHHLETQLITRKEKLHQHEQSLTALRTRGEAYQKQKAILLRQLQEMQEREKHEASRQAEIASELLALQEQEQDMQVDYDESHIIQQNFAAQKEILRQKRQDIDLVLLQESQNLGFPQAIRTQTVQNLREEWIRLQTLENASLQGHLTLELSETETRFANAEKREADAFLQCEALQHLLQETEDARYRRHQEEADLKADLHALRQEMRQIQKQNDALDSSLLQSLALQGAERKTFLQTKQALDTQIQAHIQTLQQAIQEQNPAALQTLEALLQTISRLRSAYDALFDLVYHEDSAYAERETLTQAWQDKDRQALQMEETLDIVDRDKRHAEQVRQQTQLRLQKAQGNHRSAQTERLHIGEQMARLQGQIQQQNQAHNRLLQDKDQLHAQLQSVEQLLQHYNDACHQLHNQELQLESELSAHSVSHARLNERLLALRKETSRLQKQQLDKTQSQASLAEDKAHANHNLAQMEEELQQDTTQEQRLTEILQTLQNDILHDNEALARLQQEQAILETLLKQCAEHTQKAEAQILQIQTSLAERQQSLQDLLQSSYASHQLDVRAVLLPEGVTLDQLTLGITRIREQMQAMGKVNLLAETQFQNVKDRLAYLIHQKQDIEDAMQQTRQLIADTQSESNALFIQAFAEVRGAFRALFSQLFDGGDADLVLLDPSRPLESGIDIKAEPPGQRFQSVSLLSGGQRAMVAIAVIFAILSLRPTPFVILDEMDAPLDDENIERFKALLQKFKSHSQFLVVSHSKSTLEVCDALYGVTMEELGCSKVVSVAFNDAEILIAR